MEKIIESLSPLEKKIVPFLNLEFDQIIEKSGLDFVSVVRAMQFLENKGILKMNEIKKSVINLGTNGLYYKKNHLPERKLLLLLEKSNHITIEEAQKVSKLTPNEFKAALGVLKKKNLINLSNGKISLATSKEEIIRIFAEEKLIDSLPRDLDSLSAEEKESLENLKSRKEIVEVAEEKNISYSLTELGKSIAGKKISSDLIEEITPEIIKSGTKGKKFRRYDLNAPVPRLNGGKKHFVNQSIEYVKEIWTNMGFKEMDGNLIDTSFWIFDALFTPQDHPAREMQDTFFIKGIRGKLPNKEIFDKIKEVHEKGLEKSKGWNYKWSEEEARKIALRTHTTNLSVRQISKIDKKDLPLKYFAIGKVFRNETLDWNHSFEFYQTEGIVIDRNANFRQLLGYLKLFYNKMGFEKIRFRPSFFAYTEPSVEIEVFHPEKKVWLELGGAGIFRPEVTKPLLGETIPILAWGQGFDRIIMDYYAIKDLREMYANNLKNLREKKVWKR